MNHFSLRQDSFCTEVQDTLEAYLADELDGDTHAIVEAHIASCPKCQDEVHFAQAISEALHELPRPEPPPEIFDAVAAYVRAHPDKGERWWHRIFPLSTFWDNLTLPLARAGALVCLLGIVLFGSYQYQQYKKIAQASRDLNYALSKLNYAVERTNTVVSEKLPDARINRVSSYPFVQIEAASRLCDRNKKRIFHPQFIGVWITLTGYLQSIQIQNIIKPPQQEGETP